jgi:hypothetical protein
VDKLKETITSRKFLSTLAGCIVVIGNQYFGMHLNQDTVFGLVMLISTYVIGQGYVDGKKAGK